MPVEDRNRRRLRKDDGMKGLAALARHTEPQAVTAKLHLGIMTINAALSAAVMLEEHGTG